MRALPGVLLTVLVAGCHFDKLFVQVAAVDDQDNVVTSFSGTINVGVP